MKSITYDKQHIYFAKIPVMTLVNKYQTPLFVYDQDEILDRIRKIKNLCSDQDMSIYYASKAFLTLAMAHIIKENDLGIDVASRGELFIALQGHIEPNKILYHGNNKSIDDLNYAIHHGVRRFVIDSLPELMLVNELSESLKCRLEVLIRVIPKIEGIHTHKNITTGHQRSKFGIDMDRSLDEVAKIILHTKYIDFKGLHFHLGSQLFTNQYHLEALDPIFGYIQKFKDTYQIIVRELNIGGGFGIRYQDHDQPMEMDAFLEPIIEKTERLAQMIKILRPHLSIEPGRWIVGGTAIILYRVGMIKDGIPFPMAAINGGMTENLRVALYQAKYQVLLINQEPRPVETYTIVGQACESTDLMVENVDLPQLTSGDILAFLNAGAYEHSLANNFNKISKPAVIMIHQGQDRIIQEREDYIDLIKRDHI